MRLPGTTSLFILLFFIPATILVAQSPTEDSIFYKKSVDNLVSLYKNAAGDQSRLYNGSQYGGYFFKFENGHPFFKDDHAGIGSVIYDGVAYDSVALQLDEVQEALIEDSSRRIQLRNERVERFYLFGNHFIRIVKDTQSARPVKTGFYILLYEGKYTVLKREGKLIREEVSTGTLLRYIDVYTDYYVKKGNGYFPIRSRGGLLDVFADRKKDIRQFMRKNKLKFRKDKDETLKQVAAYYDQLTH